MKLDKAIEILKERGIPWGGPALENHYKARQLGIEALKMVNAMGECPFCHVPFTLPGETEE